jgi:hypothetical protein
MYALRKVAHARGPSTGMDPFRAFLIGLGPA